MRRVLSSRETHDAWVTAWMVRATGRSRPVQRLALFDQAIAALWRRAALTLGDLTLSTVIERTLREAAATFPQLSSLKLEAAGVSLRELRERETAAPDPALTEALRFLLVEVLTALGHLTGEALTPLLHRELGKCGRQPDPADSPAAARPGAGA